MDGRTFERPVNYVLVRITPPAGATVDPRKRPFVIFDPRAGQGPGIGGMKHESEIGEACRRDIPAISSASCRSDTRSDHRGRCHAEARSSPRSGAASGSGGQALFDRQLPGRLANHDDERHPTGSGRPVLVAGRRFHTGRARTARRRCATPAGYSAAPG